MPDSKNRSTDICILICSYDGAEELWLPLAQTYKKFWPDCPYKIYLGTNKKNPTLDPFIPLCIGEEKSWSDNILKCIDKINDEYILLIFDDLFLHKVIDSEKILNYSRLAMKNNWSCLRLNPLPMFDQRIDKNIGRMNEDRLYRTSTVWALYKKSVLKDLLVPTESAWEFEILGSDRSNKYDDFYSIDETVLPYLNGVVKGKWVRSIYNYLNKEGFTVSDRTIKRMNYRENVIFRFIEFRSWFFRIFIPKSIQLRIRKLFY